MNESINQSMKELIELSVELGRLKGVNSQLMERVKFLEDQNKERLERNPKGFK